MSRHSQLQWTFALGTYVLKGCEATTLAWSRFNEGISISTAHDMPPKNRALHIGATGDETDVSSPWQDDNQAWWDWYVGLADNSIGAPAKGALPKTSVRLEPDVQTTPVLETDALRAELSDPYPLERGHVAFFEREGFIKLPGVLSPRAVATLRHEIVRILEGTFSTQLDRPVLAPSGEQENAQAGRRFFSAEMAWLSNETIRTFVLSPRIAGICAQLLGVPGIRLYHDNLLSKEPGCGRTPWHYDDHHFPLATNDVVTAWIAAQAIPKEMGPLAFAKGIDTWKLVETVPFSKADSSYDTLVAETFERERIKVSDDAFAVGDVSFHHNLSFHTAGANRTLFSRCALANTFYADGARIVDHPTMVSGDWQKFLPGVDPGESAASPLNPICWPAPSDWHDYTPNTDHSPK